MLEQFPRLWQKKHEWKSINIIEQNVLFNVSQIPKLDLRQKINILVIDDQPFDPMTNLRNNKYNITHVQDIEDITIVRPYQIVLCDLQGVGAALSRDLQGAHVIREIKEHFPEKVVIAYSGIAKHKDMSRAAAEYADQYIKKDASLDDWIEALDHFVYASANPINGWKTVRLRMLNAGITPEQLMKLEDEFVRGLEKKDAKLSEKLEMAAKKYGVSDDLRAVINGLVSSTIFRLLIG